MGDKGKVYAFEPDPTNFALLRKNIEENNYKNIIPEQKAVSNKSWRTRLYLCKENLAAHSLAKINKNYETSVEVNNIRLDDYFKDFDKEITFIKMDIEGFEGYAIEGAKKIFANPKLKFITEFLPIALENSGFEPKTYLNLLKKKGFKLYYLDEKEQKVTLMDTQEIIDGSTYAKNLLCVR